MCYVLWASSIIPQAPTAGSLGAHGCPSGNARKSGWILRQRDLDAPEAQIPSSGAIRGDRARKTRPSGQSSSLNKTFREDLASLELGNVETRPRLALMLVTGRRAHW
jgi:hypothetical protein